MNYITKAVIVVFGVLVFLPALRAELKGEVVEVDGPASRGRERRRRAPVKTVKDGASVGQ